MNLALPTTMAAALLAGLTGCNGCDGTGSDRTATSAGSGGSAASAASGGGGSAGNNNSGGAGKNHTGGTSGADAAVDTGLTAGTAGSGPSLQEIVERSATYFDGVHDAYNFGKSSRLTFQDGDTITVAGWVKPTDIDGYDPILSKPSPCANAGNYLIDFDGGRLRLCYQGATDGHCAWISTQPVALNQWTHFAVTYRFGASASFRAYINGSLTNTGTWYYGTGSEGPQANVDQAVHAGHFAGCPTGTNYFFHGGISRLVLYDRALSEAEIQAHANASLSLPCTDIAHELRPVDLTLLDPVATGYATFQSFNQKVIQNDLGIFTSHIRTRNEEYTAQTWRLSRSTDNGASFQTVFEETVGTNPPVLETDLEGNVYAMRQDYGVSLDSFLYTFSPANAYQTHTTLTIPNGNSGKYAMRYDPLRHRLYYFSHAGSFYTIDPSVSSVSGYGLIVAGPSAGPQYPLLNLDEDGTIYAAWTTQKLDEYMYWSIHVVRSTDGGASWQKLDGTPLSLPIVCDQTGPADRITLDDEYNYHTWLWNLLPKHGKIHFAYLAQTPSPRQHYVRYDALSGKEDLRLQPDFGGSQLWLRNLDGFVVSDPWSPRRLFWVSRTTDAAGQLGVLQSIDDGTTWYDYAATTTAQGNLWSIGGLREVTASGYLIGTFTDETDLTLIPAEFFRVQVRKDVDPLLCY